VFVASLCERRWRDWIATAKYPYIEKEFRLIPPAVELGFGKKEDAERGKKKIE
jgi:hypothetical protein